MIFGDHMAGLVLNGTKTQTRRPINHPTPWSWEATCHYRAGHAYAIQRGRGLPSIGTRVLVTHVERQRLGDLTDHDARAEGFPDRAAFLRHWTSLHPTTQIPPRAWTELAHLAACAPHPAPPTDPRAAIGLERRGWATRDIPDHITPGHDGRWQLTHAGAHAASTPHPALDEPVWVITFHLDDRDRVHLLTPAARPAHDELGYTEQLGLAMSDEPEAVNPAEIERWGRQSEIRRLTERAREERERLGRSLSTRLNLAIRDADDAAIAAIQTDLADLRNAA